MKKNPLLWISAGYALFLELFVIIVLVYMQVTTEQLIVIGSLSYAILFFTITIIFGLCQMGNDYYE